MIDYTELTVEELSRIEAIAHNEGRTTEAALLDALARVMGERDELENDDEMTLTEWERKFGPATEYRDFFYQCFECLNGHYPAPSVTSDHDKSVIFDAIRKGEGIDAYLIGELPGKKRGYL